MKAILSTRLFLGIISSPLIRRALWIIFWLWRCSKIGDNEFWIADAILGLNESNADWSHETRKKLGLKNDARFTVVVYFFKQFTTTIIGISTLNLLWKNQTVKKHPKLIHVKNQSCFNSDSFDILNLVLQRNSFNDAYHFYICRFWI